VADAERELEPTHEHEVTPLELFFDLVFVFAITQVASVLPDDATWGGAPRDARPRGALVNVERIRVVDEHDGCRRGCRGNESAQRGSGRT